MNRPANISRYIKLMVAEPLDQEVMRAWYDSVKTFAPNGVISTIQTTDESGTLRSATLVHRENGGKHEYIVPLTRDLTDKEAAPIVEDFSTTHPDLDFDAEVSSAQADIYSQPSVEVADDKYAELCAAWARRQHENWKKDREDSGWRYGPTISVSNKTHPLIRPWHELPDQFRKVDMDQPQGLLDLLNDQGYAVIGRSELEGILRLLRGQ